MDDKTIQEIMERNKEEITKKIDAQIMNDITSSLSYSLRSNIGEAVADFINSEIKPEVIKRLAVKKEEIIEGVCAEVPNIALSISQALSKKVAEALATNYKVNETAKESRRVQQTVMPDGNTCMATDQKELERQIMSVSVPKNEREWWAKRRIEELQDFAIWMTGCGYDFCQHEYFCKKRDELLKAYDIKHECFPEGCD